MKYKIYTTSTCFSEYTVEASSEEEAKENFSDGRFEKEDITDYQNEEIEKVEKLEPLKDKAYVSNCCGAEIQDGISWTDGEGISRCSECYEGCAIEELKED